MCEKIYLSDIVEGQELTEKEIKYNGLSYVTEYKQHRDYWDKDEVLYFFEQEGDKLKYQFKTAMTE